jgi:hypothetical protein
VKNDLKRSAENFCEDFYPEISILIKENKYAWQSFGVVSAFGAGTFSIVFALACNLIALLPVSPVEVHFFKQISFGFFALFLPLLMLGAHFLDLLEEKARKYSNF